MKLKGVRGGARVEKRKQITNRLLLSCCCHGKCSDGSSGCGLLIMNEWVNLRKWCVYEFQYFGNKQCRLFILRL